MCSLRIKKEINRTMKKLKPKKKIYDFEEKEDEETDRERERGVPE